MKLGRLILVLGLTFLPTLVSADSVILSNPYDSSDRVFQRSSTYAVATQEIGSGFQLTVSSLEMYTDNAGAFSLGMRLDCYTDSAYTISCGSSSTGTTTATVGIKDFAKASIGQYEMETSKYYKLRVTWTGGASARIVGNDFNGVSTWPAGAEIVSGAGCSGNGCPSSLVFNFYGDTDDGIFPVQPFDGEYISSNPVRFSGTYNNCGGFQYLYIRTLVSHNVTGSTTSALLPISQCGFQRSYSALYTFPRAGLYTYKAQLVSDAGFTFSTTLTASSSFTLASTAIVASTTIGDFPIDFTGVTVSSSTALNVSCDQYSSLFSNSFCQLFLTVFVPEPAQISAYSDLYQTIKQKPPLGYFYAVTAGFSGGTTTATTTTLGILQEEMSEIWSPVSTAMGYLIWFLLAVWMFHRIRRWEFQT